MKILIRNLSRTTTEATLTELFSAFGHVQSCTIVKDSNTGLSKGFGFVEIPEKGAAKAAVKNLNASNIDDSIVRVKYA